MFARWFLFICAVTAAVLSQHAATAHTFSPGLLEIREGDGGQVKILWVPPDENADALTLILPCPEIARRSITMQRGEGVEMDVFCQNGLQDKTLTIQGIETQPVDVIARWIDFGGLTHTKRLHSREPSWTFGGATAQAHGKVDVGAWNALTMYGLLGVEHILFGFDHLLFVLGLWLLIPQARALVWTISAFTVAHSVTLAAAALGAVSLPSSPVEAVIALSILLLAVELSRPQDALQEPKTLTRRFPWAVALGFGLLHGFGFAGALSEIGLPEDQAPLALLGFNLGVEFGQLGLLVSALGLRAVSVRVLPPIILLNARPIAIYGMGSVSVMWLLERV